MSSKRLQKELMEMKTSAPPSFQILTVDESNIGIWNLLFVPNFEPYKNGAFKVIVNFPAEYPFKPPLVTFANKIYHPNVDEKGLVCLTMINTDAWKPATRVHQVLEALLKLIAEPELGHPTRPEIADEYVKDKKKFCATADEWTKKFGEKRPG